MIYLVTIRASGQAVYQGPRAYSAWIAYDRYRQAGVSARITLDGVTLSECEELLIQ